MPAITAIAQATAPADDVLTLTDVLRDIPHDPATILVYVLVLIAVGAVVWGGRKRPPRTPSAG